MTGALTNEQLEHRQEYSETTEGRQKSGCCKSKNYQKPGELMSAEKTWLC